MFSSKRLHRKKHEEVATPERQAEAKPSRKAEKSARPDAAESAPKKEKKIRRPEKHGLFVLHPGVGKYVKADVIAIHGFGGHAFKSFTDKQGHMWLSDSLPDLVPQARIATFGYDSATWSGSKSTIREFALDLLERIRILRETDREKDRSIIFLCHSFGGLVCKKALIIAHEQPEFKPILDKVQGILFMGTPHRGSKLAGLAKPLSNIINLALHRKKIRSDLIENLEIGSNTITEINMSAVYRLAPLEIVSFYEQKVDAIGCRVVEPFSAILEIPNEKALPISTDHSGMVQLSPSEKEKYRPVWTAISELVSNSRSNREEISHWAAARDMLDMLYCVDYSRFLLDAPNSHPGTCTWILEDRRFAQWLNDPCCGVFWLHGHPGRGKTVLARFLVETFRSPQQAYSQIQDIKSFKLAQYLLLEQDQRRGSETVILRSLLHQLVLEDPSISETIQYYFDLERRIKTPEEDSQALWKALEGVLELDRMKKVIIIIDALDELDYRTLSSVLGGLTRLIHEIQERQSSRTIKLIVTSRPNESIDRLLEKSRPLKMEIKSKEGIQSFIRNEVLEFGERNRFPRGACNEIISEITTKADGMFLWASLAWANFKEGVTFWSPPMVEKQLQALQNLPLGLTSLYRSLLSKMQPPQLRELKPLFQCILAARRPLTCDEMAEALAVHGCQKYSDLKTAFSIARTVEVTCPNFVQIDLDGTLRFVHQSIKDFFLDNVENGHQSTFNLGGFQEVMAKICIEYLNLLGLPKPNDLGAWEIGPRYSSPEFKLLEYASTGLCYHMESVKPKDDMWLSFRQLILENRCDVEIPWDRKPLRLAARKDSSILIAMFLKAGCDINEKFKFPDGDGGSTLHFCIHRRKVEMTKYLLQKGADPNIHDYCQRTPLHLAIRDQHNELIEVLISNPLVDINARDSDGRTPLHWAVMGISEDLLDKLLKDPRLDVSMVDNDKRSALTYAAYWGHENGVKYILNNSTSLQQHRETDLSPVICAAQQGWKELTIELIGRVVNINQHRGTDRKGILHWAAIYDWDSVIQFAVESAGAKLNQIDASGKTPLHYAAELGNHAATKRLLRCGASVRMNDSSGMTAIQRAAMEGFADVLNLLLQESNYDINERDDQGCTLLHWAASWDWVSIIRIVTEHPDVDLSRKNNYGRTALHIAALCGCPNVLRILIELEYYDNNQTDAFGNSLLHLGARIGSENVVKQVLKLPLFDINRHNNFGQTARTIAEIYWKTEVEDILRDAGVRWGWGPRAANPRYAFRPSTYEKTSRHTSDISWAIATQEQIEADDERRREFHITSRLGQEDEPTYNSEFRL